MVAEQQRLPIHIASTDSPAEAVIVLDGILDEFDVLHHGLEGQDASVIGDEILGVAPKLGIRAIGDGLVEFLDSFDFHNETHYAQPAPNVKHLIS